jgi:hypothetical protein
LKACGCCARAGNGHDPNIVADLVLMSADDLAQPAANAVSRNGRTESARSNKAGAESIALRYREYAQNKKLSALCASVILYLVEFGRPS